ncbi:MAG TPA: TIGR03118 family protein [Pseudolabrys sp.]|nr:TIGR03118 family protein [Pseudolabrys sp.]
MVIAVSALCSGAFRADADTYVQTNLASDIPGLATVTDPLLVNTWGLVSSAAGSPFWISNQGTNTSTLYAVTGATNVSKVTAVNAQGFVGIPTTVTGPQGPTGIVSNANTAAFQLVPGTPTTSARFIFANLNGTISGWAGGLTSTIQVTTPGALYTGLAIDSATTGTRLYAANGAGTGSINVFGSNFAPLSLPGNFTTPNLPAGFVPFNVQTLNGQVYVTYAPAGRPNQIGALPGQGIVSVFDQNGNFVRQLITGGPLAAPWGLALAPASFGQFANDLLVGNFSSVASGINAFNPNTGMFEGMIPINVGLGNTAGGLWALFFGNGGNGGDPNTLYFTDGIDGEAHGLFGAIQNTPLPGALPLFATGLGALALLGWKRKRKAQAAA